MILYTDNDPKVCAWLRELQPEVIPPGLVAEQDIRNFKTSPYALQHYTQAHFFAGIGGWPYALQLAGWPTDRPVWTASLPCQPFSCAGKGEGKSDERNLWEPFFDLVRACWPVTIIGEQVKAAIGFGWLDRVFGDLEKEGYTCGAAVLGAFSVGAPHIRQRLYWVAHADTGRFGSRSGTEPEGSKQESRNGIAEQRGGTRGLAHDESRRLGIDGSAPGLTGHVDECSADGGLANSSSDRRTAGRGNERGAEGARSENGNHPERRGEFCGMAHAASLSGSEHGREPRQGLRRESAEADGPDRRGNNESLGDAPDERLQGRATETLSRSRREEEGRATEPSGCSSGERLDNSSSARSELERRRTGQVEGRVRGSESGRADGFWSNSILIPCRDGKDRRIEPGIFPLAARLPRSMVPSGDPSVEEANTSQEARVMRLRGYGNSIVPQVAAEFIRAFMEATA